MSKKEKQRKKLMNTDNSVMTAVVGGAEGGRGGYGGINGDGWRLDLG